MKNQQKWLTDKLKGAWMDKDLIIEIVLFESLVNFVEEEKGLENIDYGWTEELEKGHVSEEYVENLALCQRELMHAYKYIKEKRPKMIKELEELLNGDDVKKYFELVKEIQDEDTVIMTIIVEHRGFLWT